MRLCAFHTIGHVMAGADWERLAPADADQQQEPTMREACCEHLTGWHARHGCLCCDCTQPGPYVPPPELDDTWTPPGTVGGKWTRLNQRTGIYETWPPDGPR